MRSDLSLASTALRRGAVHRIEDGRGLAVQCLSGRLWLTQEGDPRDIVLEPGDLAPIERDGLSIVAALRDSSFVLLAANPAAPIGLAGAAHRGARSAP